jgi:hypothetical protein
MNAKSAYWQKSSSESARDSYFLKIKGVKE